MDATKETELLSTVNDIGGDTDCILQMLKSVKEHHKEENTMDSNLAAALLSQNNRNNNGLWDNPWIYFVWMAMFANRGCGGGLFGGGGDCGQAAQTQMLNSLGEIKAGLVGAEMQNNQLINEVGRIAQSMGYNKDFVTAAIAQNKDAICNCCSQLQMALCQNGHETAMQLCNVGNMVQSGTAQVVQAIQNCCCQTNLNIERTGNTISKELCALGTSMNSQFSSLQFNNQLQANAVLAAIAADGDKTRDLMRQQKLDEVTRERDLALAQLSQNAQTANLRDYMDVKLAQVFGQPYGCGYSVNAYSRTCGCNTPSAVNPNGSQAYPFYVNNTQTTGTAA